MTAARWQRNRGKAGYVSCTTVIQFQPEKNSHTLGHTRSPGIKASQPDRPNVISEGLENRYAGFRLRRSELTVWCFSFSQCRHCKAMSRPRPEPRPWNSHVRVCEAGRRGDISSWASSWAPSSQVPRLGLVRHVECFPTDHKPPPPGTSLLSTLWSHLWVL